MSTWLDTETRALLQRVPPGKLAPSDTATFALVLLATAGVDMLRLTEAVQRVVDGERYVTRAIRRWSLPVIVKRGLSHEDALLGQFELVCCDAVSVFVADEVVAEAEQGYLTDLYRLLLQSPEFEHLEVRLEHLPPDERGREFARQFLGRAEVETPLYLRLMRKKARIMQHWAEKFGGRVILLPERAGVEQ